MKRLIFSIIVTFLITSTAYAMDSEHSGAWYYSLQDGHGFSIVVGESNGTPLVVVYWYVYDSSGFPVFLIGTGVPDENGVEIAFKAHYGMKYGEFIPESLQRPDAGIGIFTFSDARNGTFVYSPSQWTMDNYGHTAHDMPIVKLFGVAPFTVDTGEPVSRIGMWSGRMIYDRGSAAGNACYDADVQAGVSATGSGILFLDSITVRPDTGGLYINSTLSMVMSAGVVSGQIVVSSQAVDYTISFDNYGNAEGVWTYENSECYGDWTFTKD